MSLSYTALLLETNTKHPLDRLANQEDILQDLPKVFVSTHNPNRNNRTNKAFSDELEEQLRLDAQYVMRPTLSTFLGICEKLLNSWQKANYNEGQRSGKRNASGHEQERDRKRSAEGSASTVKSAEICEGCGMTGHHGNQVCKTGSYSSITFKLFEN